MQTSAITIFSLALISVTVSVPIASVAKARADNGILNLFAQSNLLGASADPAVTTECFNHFMPILNEISTNFSVQYEQCVTVASQASAKLSANTAQNRATFVNETSAICSAFTSCHSDTDNLDFFNCYATAASADVNEIYNLWTDSSNAAISLKGGLQEIKDTEDICTNTAQSIYTEKTSATFRELKECFINGLQISINCHKNLMHEY